MPDGPKASRKRQRKVAIHAQPEQGIRAVVEDLHALHGLLILDEDDEVGVQHVVNQRAHLVADAFDAMLAAAAVGQRGALIRLERGDLGFRKCGLDLVAGGERAR